MVSFLQLDHKRNATGPSIGVTVTYCCKRHGKQTLHTDTNNFKECLVNCRTNGFNATGCNRRSKITHCCIYT